jgi:hypothetical protein
VQPVESLGGASWLFTLQDDEPEPQMWWCLECGFEAVAEVGWTVFMVSAPKQQRALFK